MAGSHGQQAGAHFEMESGAARRGLVVAGHRRGSHLLHDGARRRALAPRALHRARGWKNPVGCRGFQKRRAAAQTQAQQLRIPHPAARRGSSLCHLRHDGHRLPRGERRRKNLGEPRLAVGPAKRPRRQYERLWQIAAHPVRRRGCAIRGRAFKKRRQARVEKRAQRKARPPEQAKGYAQGLWHACRHQCGWQTREHHDGCGASLRTRPEYRQGTLAYRHARFFQRAAASQ